MFYCRESELGELMRRYKRDKFECIILYGRRRVGKTALINEFFKGKDVIYFSALRDTLQGNTEALSFAIGEYKEPGASAHPVYHTLQDAFSAIGSLAAEKRLIFIIDEYPYLAKADPSVASRLQHLIDREWSRGRMFLILCGSSVSFMEDDVLAYESPLYGRRTGQIHLKPLTYLDCAEFLPDADEETKAYIYGITGGVPMYINLLECEGDIHAALKANFFNTSAYLFEEPENLLKQELREPSVYNAVIKAIANGASRMHDVASKAGIDTSSCGKYIRVLTELHILSKETPAGEKEGRRSVLQIEDPFFRFWYRFVPGNMGLIESNRFESAYDRIVRDHMHDFMGPLFERMCREYLMYYADDLPFPLNETARWWGTDPAQKREIEIDLVGIPADTNRHSASECLLASCKFRNKKADADVLAALKHYGEVFAPGAAKHYYIFSASGFTDSAKKLAEEESARLITLQDLYAAKRNNAV